MSHTPAPWRVENGKVSKEHTIFGPPAPEMKTGYILARVCHSNLFNDKGKEGLANARLIAAAPELLEALEAIKETAMPHEGPSNPQGMALFQIVQTAQAAITKTTL